MLLSLKSSRLSVSAARLPAFLYRMRFLMPFAATVTIRFTTALPPLPVSNLPSLDRMAKAVSFASSPEFRDDR